MCNFFVGICQFVIDKGGCGGCDSSWWFYEFLKAKSFTKFYILFCFGWYFIAPFIMLLFLLCSCLIWRFINNANCNWFCFCNNKFDKDIFYFIWKTSFSIVTNHISEVTDYTSTVSVLITSNVAVSVNGNFWTTNRII